MSKRKTTILNEEGKQISVEKYDEIDFEGFINGRAIVYYNGKAGLINENGKEICPPKYDLILPFKQTGCPTIVGLDGKYGLMDKDGKEICPLKYCRIDRFEIDGHAFSKCGKNMMYLTKDGKEIPIVDLT